jgi:nucleoside-diphosphate-sugar epimerase
VDISRAFLAALEAPREMVHNQAINVGQNSENYNIRELAEIVADVVPNCQIEYAPDAGPDKRSYRVDFGKIQQALPAFKPEWNVRRGVEELYDAYRKIDLSRTDFEGPRYRRIDHLKKLMSSGRIAEDLRWVDQFELARHN